MTAHVVSFEPAGAPTRAVCSKCGVIPSHPRVTSDLFFVRTAAETHAYFYAPDSRIEFAGLPPVERAS